MSVPGGTGVGSVARSMIVISVLIAPSSVGAQTTRYVDQQLTAACTTYAPATRACGAGTAAAYRDLQTASQAAQPGDTVLVRQGTFTTQFAPATSGTPSSPITFRAYPSETVTITNVGSPAISLLNRSYLVIDGFTVTNVVGWGRIEASHHNLIQNSRFTTATAGGTTGGLKFVRSHYNRVLNNTISDGNDNLGLHESDRNLIAGNTFTKARHTLLNISCGNFNIVRDNTFNNVDQKAVENYDCEGTVSGQAVKLDSTKHNVWERNIFSGTKASTRDYDYNAMQYSGQNGIVRKNVYYDNLGGGISFQVYSDEALYNYGHRVYNNTFYNNRCGAIGASDDVAPTRYYDNRVRNNLLYKNADCSGGPTQVSIDNPTAVVLTNNAILTASPGFIDEAGRDLRLQSTSPQIDAATFVSATVGSGTGTTLSVTDAAFFRDSYGIDGEVGDTIQLAGQTERATIVAVDYANGVLTLSSPLTWTNGQGVALAYEGAAPDMGAYENNATTPRPPTAPTGLRIVS